MAGRGRQNPGGYGRTTALVGLVALMVLAAGCGGSSKGTAAPSQSATTSATTPVTTAGGSGATTGSSSSASTHTCPAASVVNSMLGVHVGSPTRALQPFGVSCTYPGLAIPVRIAFQEDTRATFASGERAVSSAGGVVTVTAIPGLGDAAYGVDGFLAVLSGSTAVRITAPLSTLSQLEALARTVLAS